jgi:hypothetical protein
LPIVLLEPDVALTDYALAVEAAVFAWALARGPQRSTSIRRALVLFFSSLSVAAALGGTVHGFTAASSAWFAVLWPATMIAIGATAASAWWLGALLLLTASFARWIAIAAGVEFFAYSIAVVFFRRDFAFAIFNYLPSAAFLLAALLVQLIRTRRSEYLLGSAGMVLTFIAAAVQYFHVPLYPPYVGHNAFYHLLQMIALALLFLWARQASTR